RRGTAVLPQGHLVMTRALVCGGRDFRDGGLLFRTLDTFHARESITCLIEGGARGADLLARAWATGRRIDNDTYLADWRRHGRGAGPVRNRLMLEDGKPDVVIAFPGGAGTANMVSIARKAGVRVIEVSGYRGADAD